VGLPTRDRRGTGVPYSVERSRGSFQPRLAGEDGIDGDKASPSGVGTDDETYQAALQAAAGDLLAAIGTITGSPV
jgi:hypothetical protein